MRIIYFANGALTLQLQCEAVAVTDGYVLHTALYIDTLGHTWVTSGQKSGRLTSPAGVQDFACLPGVMQGRVLLHSCDLFCPADRGERVHLQYELDFNALYDGEMINTVTVEDDITLPAPVTSGRVTVMAGKAFEDVQVQVESADPGCSHKITLYADGLEVESLHLAAGQSDGIFLASTISPRLYAATCCATCYRLHAKCETEKDGLPTGKPTYSAPVTVYIGQTPTTAPVMPDFEVHFDGNGGVGVTTATLRLDPALAFGQAGAYIVAFEADFDGQRYYIPYSGQQQIAVTHTPYEGGDISLTALDSRGFAATKVYQSETVPYFAPRLESCSLSKGKLALQVKYYDQMTDQGPNILSVQVKLKQAGGGKATVISHFDTQILGSTAKYEAEVGHLLQPGMLYEAEVVMTDLVKSGSDSAFLTATAGADLQNVYPVGSFYFSSNDTDPTQLFGFGTWQRVKDKFLLAAGELYGAGEEGGEATVKLAKTHMPSHDHRVRTNRTESYPAYFHTTHTGSGNSSNGWAYLSTSGTYNSGVGTLYVESVGDNTPHNNMPPFVAVYVWQRTA